MPLVPDLTTDELRILNAIVREDVSHLEQGAFEALLEKFPTRTCGELIEARYINMDRLYGNFINLGPVKLDGYIPRREVSWAFGNDVITSSFDASTPVDCWLLTDLRGALALHIPIIEEDPVLCL